jgi:hypothetical protein
LPVGSINIRPDDRILEMSGVSRRLRNLFRIHFAIQMVCMDAWAELTTPLHIGGY